MADLVLVNAATHEKLVIAKKGGFYKIDNSVVIGNLYIDPAMPELAVVEVLKEVALEDIDNIAAETGTATKSGAVPNPASVIGGVTRSGQTPGVDPSRLNIQR